MYGFDHGSGYGNRSCRMWIREKKDSGTQGASNEDVTLTFWSWLPTNDQSEEMINEFEKENPNIHIDYTRTEQDDFLRSFRSLWHLEQVLIYMV